MQDSEKLDKILKEVEEIKKILNRLLDKSEDIEESCKGMDSHIDFVNNVYSTLRAPLDWITNKVSGETLPEPQKKSFLTKLITSP